MEARATVAMKYIDERKGLLCEVADRIWRYAELALHEEQSARELVQMLRTEGFRIDEGVAGMPTAFVATWGSGRPVIGLLGEYDALGGMSQATEAARQELVPGGSGHACGHNLLGTAAAGAAMGLRIEMETRGLPGTIKYFGCPAEENISGKAFMAREGLFSDCDACLTWHPAAMNQVRAASSTAVDSMNITFSGRTAHAAADPHNGRSALDAVMLMNMACEFLREHIATAARMHYVITDGGNQPNVVPATATVWYMIRSPQRSEVDELHARVIDCAAGAALMTGTTYRVDMVESIYNLLDNDVLNDVLAQAMERTGPPRFTEEDVDFGRQIGETFRENREAFLKRGDPELKGLEDQIINDTVLPRAMPRGEPYGGSTDVADVSWACPTAQFLMACNAIGTPGHSWQFAAQAGTGIGRAGMLAAARVLAEAGLDLLMNPAVLEAAKKEFAERTGGMPFKSAMPEGLKPAFAQFQ